MPALEVVDCPVRSLTSGPRSHFFGYYDKSPWTKGGHQRTLAHRTEVKGRMPAIAESVELGLVDQAGEFASFATSRAWNFQQGAMLQWLPKSSQTVLYNDTIGTRAVGVRLDLKSGQKFHYSRPIASVSPCGSRALSINFGRLSTLKPEYGYAGVVDAFEGMSCPAEDGIWEIDFSTGDSKKLLSLKEIVELGGGDHLDATHYINHVMYSQAGGKFCFLHRYINAVGTQNTRLFSCNLDGSGLTLLMTGMASHFGWRGDTELLAWASPRSILGSATGPGLLGRLPVGVALRKLYRILGKPAALKSRVMKDRYIMFHIASGATTTIGRNVLKSDGHCTFSPDGRWFVTDTYPDRRGFASLLIGCIETETFYQVAQFKMPRELDNEIRCDLHPRWHPTDARICVDVAEADMSRQLYEVDVSSVVGRRD